MEDELRIEGRNSVEEAIKRGIVQKLQIEKRVVPRYREIIREAKEKGVPIQEVPSLDVKQGIVAYIFPVQPWDIEEFIDKSFIVVADGVEDPYNLGAIIRTAECAGVDGIVFPKHRSSLISKGLISSSSGAIFHIPFSVVTNTAQSIDRFIQAGFSIVGADPEGEAYFNIDFGFPTVLVIGGEDKGLRPIIKKRCNILAGIPMRGKLNSLNTSVAAGILIYEIAKKIFIQGGMKR
ncbi:MAG: 23S rRNA (guanosine(2251)-2'-O)-methyltransferase RlmB [bacterium]